MSVERDSAFVVKNLLTNVETGGDGTRSESRVEMVDAGSASLMHRPEDHAVQMRSCPF